MYFIMLFWSSCALISYSMSENSKTSDQNTIAEQESLMKNLPQMQYAFDDKVSNSLNCLTGYFLFF